MTPSPTFTVTHNPNPAKREQLAALVDKYTQPAPVVRERQTVKKAV